jgi:hypothetical protein
MKPVRILVLAAASGLLINVGCSSSGGSSDSNADAGPAGGPVAAAPDDHCANVPTVLVDPSTCSGNTSASAGGAADDAGDTSASAGGAASCDQTRDVQYGNTLSNAEGDDDDCKYHAAWTSTPIRLNEPVTFTLTTTNKATGLPLEALADGQVPLTRLDVYEPCDAGRRGPTQNSTPKIAVAAPGVFTVGPIKFDQSGLWVVRFHLYEQCVDGDTSPHGHIAFFVQVP